MSKTTSKPVLNLRPNAEIEAQLAQTIGKIDNLKTLYSDLLSKKQYSIAKGVLAQLAPFNVKHDVLKWYTSNAAGAYDSMSPEIVADRLASVANEIVELTSLKESQVSENNWQVVKSIKEQLTKLEIIHKWLLWLLCDK